ncbi:hypothetical protein [Pseudovibrio sp. POLY-S9]|uniref:hypothetical protein n=1 Tax=Pseudovibrio sp. POLY-S9 TaxID=1576596 RepID=UPI00070CE73D|nr:hypothetical protein [Pseudovibrio sp. POLY-S9]
MNNYDLAAVKPYEADLAGMKDDEIKHEIASVQTMVDDESSWLEALCAEQRLRTPDWKKHVPEDERGGLIAEYDDGSAILFSSAAGGAAPSGAWSTLTLMQVDAGGAHSFRNYVACGDWHHGVEEEK